MSRFAPSPISTTVVLLTLLASIPTQLHAEPSSQQLKSAPASTPSQTISNNALPTTAQQQVNLIVKLKQKKVYVYKGNSVLASYPVSVGKKNWETPTGEWHVMEKITKPGWTNFATGKVMAPGKKNPMGERWIGFWTDGKDSIGFHGTPFPNTIGKAVTSGCIRMYDKDVKSLYSLVNNGTVVKVLNE